MLGPDVSMPLPADTSARTVTAGILRGAAALMVENALTLTEVWPRNTQLFADGITAVHIANIMF